MSNRGGRYSSPLSQLALFLMLLGGSFILSNVIAGAVIYMRTGKAGMPPLTEEYMTMYKVIQAVYSIVFFGTTAWCFAYFTRRDRPLALLGFRPAPLPAFYGIGVALLVLSWPLQAWLGEINKMIPLPGSLVESGKAVDKQIIAYLKGGNSIGALLINLFLMALLPAIFEEVCFRGALQRILIQLFKRPWVGIVVTGALFSAIHMQFEGFLPRWCLGSLLGAAYWYSGSLWVPILAHFVVNGTQVVAASYHPELLTEEPSMPWYLALGSAIIVVGLLSVLVRRSTVSYAEVYTVEYDEFLK